MRIRLAVAELSALNALSFLRFDMSGGWKEMTRVQSEMA